jgi:hypothetical protein
MFGKGLLSGREVIGAWVLRRCELFYFICYGVSVVFSFLGMIFYRSRRGSNFHSSFETFDDLIRHGRCGSIAWHGVSGLAWKLCHCTSEVSGLCNIEP